MRRKPNNATQQILGICATDIREIKSSVRDIVFAKNLIDYDIDKQERLSNVQADNIFLTFCKYGIAASSAAIGVLTGVVGAAVGDASAAVSSLAFLAIAQVAHISAKRMKPIGIAERREKLQVEIDDQKSQVIEKIAEMGFGKSLTGLYIDRTNQYTQLMSRMLTKSLRDSIAKAYAKSIDDIVEQALNTDRENLDAAIESLTYMQQCVTRGLQYYRDEQLKTPSRFKFKNRLHHATSIHAEKEFIALYEKVCHAVNDLENAKNGHTDLRSEIDDNEQVEGVVITREFPGGGLPPIISATVGNQEVEFTVNGNEITPHPDRPINRPNTNMDPKRSHLLLREAPILELRV